jgi:rRNA maturation endonuclease Nob1
MKWITCNECEEEFRVITESLSPIAFCPLCGSELYDTYDEDEDIEYDDG